MRKRVAVLLLVALGSAGAGKRRAWPQVVTQAWLGEFRLKRWPLARLVDPARGLVVIEHLVDSGREDDPGRRSGKRYCGAELDKKLAGLEEQVIDALEHADVIGCSNKPGPPACSFGVANEYTAFTRLLFLPAEGGDLRLDAILVVDGGSMGPAGYRQQARYVKAQLAKLRATDCDGNPATPSPLYRDMPGRQG